MADPTRIINLNEATTISAADQIPIYSQSDGVRRISVNTLMSFILASVEPAGDFEEQAAAPTASPATITVDPTVDGGSVWLVITPTGVIAATTINLPASGDAADGQEVLVTTTQTLTALTIAATGLNLGGGMPTTLAANGKFRVKFYAPTNTWYLIG